MYIIYIYIYISYIRCIMYIYIHVESKGMHEDLAETAKIKSTNQSINMRTSWTYTHG